MRKSLLGILFVVILCALVGSGNASPVEWPEAQDVHTTPTGLTVWTICREDWEIVLTRIDNGDGFSPTFGGVALSDDGEVLCAWNYCEDVAPYDGMSFIGEGWGDSATEALVYAMPHHGLYYANADDCDAYLMWPIPRNIAEAMWLEPFVNTHY